jgi:hypothetical protein
MTEKELVEIEAAYQCDVTHQSKQLKTDVFFREGT